MSKMSIKFLAGILSLVLICSLFISFTFASPMPGNDFITIGQNFDGLTSADLPNYVFNLATPAKKEIVSGGASADGQMLKLVSENGGQVNEGVKLLSFTEDEKAANANATAVAFWLNVKDPTPPNGGKTQIQMMMMEDNGTGNAGTFYFFGKYGDDLAATSDFIYIDKNGNATYQAAAPFISVPADFEGMVIVPFDHFTNHPAYADENKKFDPDRLLAVSFDIQASTAGSGYFVDNIGVTSNIPGLVKALTKRGMPEKGLRGIAHHMGQGFGFAKVGDTTAVIREKTIVGNNSGADLNYEIVDNTFSNGNAMKITAATGNTAFADIFLNFADYDAIADSKALAFRIKTPKLVEPNNVLLTDLMLMEGKIDDMADVGEVYMYYHVYSKELGNATTVTFVDSKTNQYVNVDLSSPYCIPGEFDGWMIVPLTYFQQHPGYVYDKGNGKLDPDLVARLQIEFDTPEKGASYYIDNIGFVDSTDAFLTSLGSTPMPVDIIETQTTGSTSTIAADKFQSVLDSGKTLTVNVNSTEGYLDYSWLFKGAEVTAPADFNPEIKFTSANKDAINSLAVDLEAFYLSFGHSGALPGKAAVTIYVGDNYADDTLLYFYSYNKDTNNLEFIAKDLKVENGGYVTLHITGALDSILTAKEVVPATAPVDTSVPSADQGNVSTDKNPVTGDQGNASIDKNPVTGDKGIVLAILALLMSCAALIIYKMKKQTV